MLRNLIIVILKFFTILRFRDLWDFKQYLYENCHVNKTLYPQAFASLLIDCYKQRMEKEGGYIDYRTFFAGKPIFPHGFQGIFISDQASIGKNTIILQQVTIGVASWRRVYPNPDPTIGDGVLLGAGAKILGGDKYWE